MGDGPMKAAPKAMTHKATFGAHFAIPNFGHLFISASGEVDPATKGAKWDFPAVP